MLGVGIESHLQRLAKVKKAEFTSVTEYFLNKRNSLSRIFIGEGKGLYSQLYLDSKYATISLQKSLILLANSSSPVAFNNVLEVLPI